MNELMARVHDHALDIRSWAETTAEQKSMSASLCGMCAVASAVLHKRLARYSIKSIICVHENTRYAHVYLTVDGFVVDITATQFSEFRNSAVVILPEDDCAMSYEFYYNPTRFHTVHQLRKYQIKAGWPYEQIAYA